MARSQQTTSKKDRQKRKQKEQKDKQDRRAERKNQKPRSFEEMVAYVDENGQFTNTPPEKKQEIKAEDIQIDTPRTEHVETDSIRTGTVTFFNESKGYGFIKDAETGQSIFVHMTALSEVISEGNRVAFEIEKGPKGPVAARVTIVR
jgi:cold shock CspA family protein